MDRPPLEARDYILERPESVTSPEGVYRYCPIGTKVRRPAIPAKSRLVGVASIYAINPCDEKSALVAIKKLTAPPLILLEMPDRAMPMLAGEFEPGEGDDDEEIGEP